MSLAAVDVGRPEADRVEEAPDGENVSAQRTSVTPEQLAKTFLRANVDKVKELLDTLASLGQARELADGRLVSPLFKLGIAQAVGAAESK